MSTGLTYAIAEGTDLTVRGYLLRWLAPWEDRNGVSYQEEQAVDPAHAEAVKRAEAHLAEVEAMTLEQAATLAQACHEEAVADWHNGFRQRAALLLRYEEMEEKLLVWQAPPALTPIREGMIRHLAGSKAHDCAPMAPCPTEACPAEEFRAGEITYAQGHLAHARRTHERHLASVAEHNRIVAALRLVPEGV